MHQNATQTQLITSHTHPTITTTGEILQDVQPISVYKPSDWSPGVAMSVTMAIAFAEGEEAEEEFRMQEMIEVDLGPDANGQSQVRLPIYLSTYLPIYLSTYLPIYLSTYLPIYSLE